MNSTKLCCIAVVATLTLFGSHEAGAAGHAAQSATGSQQVRKKNPGDLSYRTVWRMQKRVDALRPAHGQRIAPSLRLSVAGMSEVERAEFLPDDWGVVIVGKTVDASVPMRRGGYFVLPLLPEAQARSEDAIVRFNARNRKSALEVGWQVRVPAGGALAYRQFREALDELATAQQALPWWDVVARSDKRARFNALRACFTGERGKILVAGVPAGIALGRHCALLPFDPAQLQNDPAIAFDGELDFVTLDHSDNYAMPSGQP